MIGARGRSAVAALLLTASAGLEALAAPLPGSEPIPSPLAAQLKQAVAEKGRGYVPRTHHLEADGSPKYTNRLILEASPYLLQHAHNPVNWYPWGDEAFARAARERKPVLLSVGYSTCHWCHVMEGESFEDEEIAAYLNRNYIAIKVDREQRPDIDAVYMQAVQMMAGSGGWPMTVWLTPAREPFYGGTYFPPRDGVRGVRLGFLTLLQRLRAAYDEQPDKVAGAARDIVGRLRSSDAAAAERSPAGDAAARAAIESFRAGFDEANGGFGGAPKFPRPAALGFLLREARRGGDAQVRRMALRTLDAIRSGGIYDQVGGGFHRYATDARWRVPHFEKMLYDNAQLVRLYLDAYQMTGKAEYAAVARETLAYVDREMSSPGGGFYSASDADSEGVEGRFFVWTPAEIAAVLGPKRAAWFASLYGVTAEGNFDGRNILYLARPPAEVAREIGVAPEAFSTMVDEARRELYEARRKRPPPATDEKIVVSWNGLMISAEARAAFVLDDAAYARRAARAAELILGSLAAGDRLRRSALGDRAAGTGYLDDYAFFIQGLLDLFEATSEPRCLRQAMALQKALDEHFWDAAKGGYFLTPDDGEPLLARGKPDDDGAEPSGNSVAILNLLRLAELTTRDAYRQRAEQALSAFTPTIEQAPMALPAMLAAASFLAGPSLEIAVVTPADGGDAAPLLAVLRRTFVPNAVVAVTREGAALDAMAALVPWLEGKKAQNGRATAYVCRRFVCDLPTTRPEQFEAQLLR